MPFTDVSLAVHLTIGAELMLIAVEKLIPVSQKVLPLGGDHAMQIGMLLAMTVGATEVIVAIHSMA
jgi:NADH:ubiquinone oxidoreductase subunit K